jgi:hypothetical protein
MSWAPRGRFSGFAGLDTLLIVVWDFSRNNFWADGLFQNLFIFVQIILLFPENALGVEKEFAGLIEFN